MKAFMLFGLRIVGAREWQTHVAVDNAERLCKLALEEELKALHAKGQAFVTAVEEATVEQRQKNDEIRARVETVLGCNVRLAHRAEVAEHNAAMLRDQLAKVLRKS